MEIWVVENQNGTVVGAFSTYEEAHEYTKKMTYDSVSLPVYAITIGKGLIGKLANVIEQIKSYEASE